MCAAPSGGRTGYTRQMSHAFASVRRHGALRLRRRQIVLGAVTVLLHLIVFDWFGRQLGLPQQEPARAEPPLRAELINGAPQPVRVSMPPPSPKLSMPPLPELDPEPVAAADPPPPPQPQPQPQQSAPADADGGDGPPG